MAVVCATSSDAGHPRFVRYLSAWVPQDGLANIVKTVPLLPANCNLIQLLSPSVTNNATISEGSTDASKLLHTYRVSPRYYLFVKSTQGNYVYCHTWLLSPMVDKMSQTQLVCLTHFIYHW